jgi:hypothetical protein
MSKVEIKGHHRASPYTMYMTEDEVIISTYYFLEAGDLPLLRFKRAKESLYYDYKRDSDLLFKEAAPLYADDFSE